MTRLHNETRWHVMAGDRAAVTEAGLRIVHTVLSRDRDVVVMVCGQPARLRRYWTLSLGPFATGTWLPLTCLGCIADAS